MKTFCLSLVLIASTLFSNAPASAESKSAPLIRAVIGGGMPGPGGLQRLEVTLSVKGTVSVIERTYPSLEEWSGGKITETKYELAKFSKQQPIDAIRALVSRLELGPVVAKEPNAPECMDAPSKFFYVVKNGKNVEIASYRGCKDYHLADENQRHETARIKKDLETLLRFAGY